MSWWSDKPTFLHLPEKFFQGDLLICGQLMVYYYKLYELAILLFVLSQIFCKIDFDIIRNCCWHKRIDFASCMILILMQVCIEVTKNVYFFFDSIKFGKIFIQS